MRVILRAVGGIIVAAMLICFICSPVGAAEGGTENAIRLFLRATEVEGDILEVTVSLDSESGICALLCTLEYDPESLIYLSGGACDGKINFKAIDFGGSVRFLLDSRENSAAKGEIVTLYFKRIGHGSAGLALKCEGEALYCGEGADILSARVEVDGEIGSADIGCNGGREERKAPEIISLVENGGRLDFSVAVDGVCFAAGARLFFVDISGGGRHFEVVVAGVVGKDGVFEGRYLFGGDIGYAVVVTAVGYGRGRIDTGEKITLVCANGD